MKSNYTDLTLFSQRRPGVRESVRTGTTSPVAGDEPVSEPTKITFEYNPEASTTLRVSNQAGYPRMMVLPSKFMRLKKSPCLPCGIL